MEIRTPSRALAHGYARFNGGPHLCIDLPDSEFTITCRTSDGRRTTFSFCCHEDGTPAICVDVKYHGRTDTDAPPQEVICFGNGVTPFRSNAEDPVTLTTILLPECES